MCNNRLYAISCKLFAYFGHANISQKPISYSPLVRIGLLGLKDL
jgi:hypothetical protein